MILHERVYPSFLIHTTATGRWTIQNPNLQGLKGDLRDIYVPDKGMVWMKHDWSTIEPRLQAGLANDKPLLEAFKKNWDVHFTNTCEVLGIPYPPNNVDPHSTPECAEWRETYNWRGSKDVRRQFGKQFILRLLYRGRPESAGNTPWARRLQFNGPKLAQAARNWLHRHPAIEAYWARQDEHIRKYGWTQTWTERKRRAVTIRPGEKIPHSVFKELGNHPMQGGVADLKNLCIIELCDTCPWLTLAKEQHDAFWLECPREKEEETWPVYQHIVQQERNIEGVVMGFPAEFKRILPDGKEEKVTRL